MCSHDEMSPFLHRLVGTDFSVGDVGRDEAQQTLQEDLWAVVDVILLRGQLCQVVLELQEQTDTCSTSTYWWRARNNPEAEFVQQEVKRNANAGAVVRKKTKKEHLEIDTKQTSVTHLMCCMLSSAPSLLLFHDAGFISESSCLRGMSCDFFLTGDGASTDKSIFEWKHNDGLVCVGIL